MCSRRSRSPSFDSRALLAPVQMVMNRALVLSLLVSSLFLAGLISLRGELLILTLPLLVFLLAGVQHAPRRIDLEIRRELSTERADAGVPVTVRVTVRNCGGPLEELLLEDRVPAGLTVGSGSPRHVLRLGEEESYSFSYGVAGGRGRYYFETVHVTAGDALGLFVRTHHYSASGQLFVFPRVTRLRSVAIRPRRTRVYAGNIPARTGGPGTEFHGVRTYQAGDPPRTINWRATSRHPDEVFTNEYQQERVADVGIVLDGRARANTFGGGHSIFEHSVLAAASVADAFLNQGNRVGLLVYGSFLEWCLPGYGKVQRERILQALARAQAGASSVFSGLEHLSPRMFPAESQIVLISPLMQGDLQALIPLRARGCQVLVLSPDPVAFERRMLASDREVGLAARVLRLERTLLVRRLLRAGIQIVEWDVAQPFELAVRPMLARLRFPRHAGRLG